MQWCGACLQQRRSTALGVVAKQMNEEREQIENEILQYLIDHPNAQDTSKGIVDWWLMERTVKRRKRLVEDALKSLAGKDLVIKRKRSDSQTSYRINRRKRKEIISRLQHRS